MNPSRPFTSYICGEILNDATAVAQNSGVSTSPSKAFSEKLLITLLIVLLVGIIVMTFG